MSMMPRCIFFHEMVVFDALLLVCLLVAFLLVVSLPAAAVHALRDLKGPSVLEVHRHSQIMAVLSVLVRAALVACLQLSAEGRTLLRTELAKATSQEPLYLFSNGTAATDKAFVKVYDSLEKMCAEYSIVFFSGIAGSIH